MAEDDKGLGDALVREDLITREELEQARAREQDSGTPWFRQLLQAGKVDFGIMNMLLRERHAPSKRKEHETLGHTLVDMGAISETQLNEALKEQKRSGRLLGNILQDKGWVDWGHIALALSRQHHLNFVEFAKAPSEQAALDVVPESMAKRYQILPFRLEGDKLVVLITHPQVVASLSDLGVLLNRRIQPIMTDVADIREAIMERYLDPLAGTGGKRASKRTIDTNKSVQAPAAEPPVKKPKTRPKQEDAQPMTAQTQTTSEAPRFEEIAKQASGVPVIKLVQTIIDGAANSNATDIHLDPQEPEMRVRYRIDGVLHDVMSIPHDIEPAVVSRVKIMADMDITETRHPQDGHISMEVGEREFDIRVATLPTFLGERIVLRMLDQSSVLAGIRDLGLEKDDENVIMRLLTQPYGMILVTGPTGSGKTTTLYAALNQKNVMTESIVTLEDPVEYQLSGINQVQIDTDIGVTFATVLRAALRQDIDVLLVGEIRDPDTARIAIRASMTGHLVFSTLHTNDAPEAISTLRNMGIPSYLIASALTGVVGQRLVRCICENCKTSYTPPKTLLKSIRLPESTKKLYKGAGCEQCYGTGYKGRTGIFEVLEFTPDIRKLVVNDENVDKITKAAKLKTMAERARLKVKNGVTTVDEFLRVIRT